MAITRDVFMEILKDSYSAYYTIEDLSHESLPLVFRADYKASDEHFWFTKTARVWVNEKNEYCYVFSAESFSPEEAEACMNWAWDDGMPRVQPHKNHQCTNVKLVFVADRVEEDTARAVRKMSRTKNYHHGLYGYSNLLTGLVDLSTEKTVTNREGHELVPFFKKLFAARA